MSLILGILDSGGAAAPAGVLAYESIATVTVGSGGSANVEFTSIPATYTHLQIRGIVRTNRAATGDWLEITFNSDTAANYQDHYLAGNGTSASAGAQTTRNWINIDRWPGASSTASIFGVMVLDILDYANTNKYKTVRNLSGNDQNGSGEIHLSSGGWRSTSAITSIKLDVGAGTLFTQYSQFALYGIKG